MVGFLYSGYVMLRDRYDAFGAYLGISLASFNIDLAFNVLGLLRLFGLLGFNTNSFESRLLKRLDELFLNLGS